MMQAMQCCKTCCIACVPKGCICCQTLYPNCRWARPDAAGEHERKRAPSQSQIWPCGDTGQLASAPPGDVRAACPTAHRNARSALLLQTERPYLLAEAPCRVRSCQAWAWQSVCLQAGCQVERVQGQAGNWPCICYPYPHNALHFTPSEANRALPCRTCSNIPA